MKTDRFFVDSCSMTIVTSMRRIFRRSTSVTGGFGRSLGHLFSRSDAVPQNKAKEARQCGMCGISGRRLAYRWWIHDVGGGGGGDSLPISQS